MPRKNHADGLDLRRLTQNLEALPELAAIRDAARRCGCAALWLVGGRVRDLALQRHRRRPDLDLALPGDGRALAGELARTVGGSAFALDPERGAWRVDRGEHGTIDVIPLRAADLAGDLAGRDFTVNAIAFDLLQAGGLADPCGGLGDLQARRLRLCSPTALEEDPLRVLRAYRLAAALPLQLGDALARQLGSAAAGLERVARERVRDEWFALMDLPAAGVVRAMLAHGVLPVLFPFVSGWDGFAQGSYHSYDLLQHSLNTLEEVAALAAAPERFAFLGPSAPLLAHLEEEWELGITRRALLSTVALLHDVAKPDTLTRDGERYRFLSHEVRGGEKVFALLRALRVGKRTCRAAQRLVAAHLRLFQLAQQQPPTPRARLRYLRDLRRELPEAVLLSLADERATGPARPAWPAVARAAEAVLAEYWRRRDQREVAPLVRGRDLVQLGVPEGPQIGRLLREVAALERSGRVRTRPEALEWLRRQRLTPTR